MHIERRNQETIAACGRTYISMRCKSQWQIVYEAAKCVANDDDDDDDDELIGWQWQYVERAMVCVFVYYAVAATAALATFQFNWIENAKNETRSEQIKEKEMDFTLRHARGLDAATNFQPFGSAVAIGSVVVTMRAYNAI